MRVEDGTGREEHRGGDSRNEFNRFVPLFRIKRVEKSLESNIPSQYRLNDTDDVISDFNYISSHVLYNCP